MVCSHLTGFSGRSDTVITPSLPKQLPLLSPEQHFSSYLTGHPLHSFAPSILGSFSNSNTSIEGGVLRAQPPNFRFNPSTTPVHVSFEIYPELDHFLPHQPLPLWSLTCSAYWFPFHTLSSSLCSQHRPRGILIEQSNIMTAQTPLRAFFLIVPVLYCCMTNYP